MDAVDPCFGALGTVCTTTVKCWQPDIRGVETVQLNLAFQPFSARKANIGRQIRPIKDCTIRYGILRRLITRWKNIQRSRSSYHFEDVSQQAKRSSVAPKSGDRHQHLYRFTRALQHPNTVTWYHLPIEYHFLSQTSQMRQSLCPISYIIVAAL